MSQIVHLASARPQATLEHLRRLTGLDFHCCPESLLPHGPVESGSLRGKKKPASRAGARRTGSVSRIG